jgi:hypothetical protein
MKTPFKCPNCGATERWSAHYLVPASQGVPALYLVDGELVPDDYDGGEQSYDPNPNDFYQCDDCSQYVNLDGSPRDPNTPEPSEVDRRALDAIAQMLDGREWHGADDLEAIAEAVRATHRPIGPPRAEEIEEEIEEDVEPGQEN